MKKSLKDKWVKALESGNYKQGSNCLKNKSNRYNKCKYCVIGLLCNLVHKKGWVRSRYGGNMYFSYKDQMNSYMPSNQFLKDVGLSYPTCLKLTSLNDSGKSFKELAKWIKRHVSSKN